MDLFITICIVGFFIAFVLLCLGSAWVVLDALDIHPFAKESSGAAAVRMRREQDIDEWYWQHGRYHPAAMVDYEMPSLHAGYGEGPVNPSGYGPPDLIEPRPRRSAATSTMRASTRYV